MKKSIFTGKAFATIALTGEKKVLIIKTGYSEILNKEKDSQKVSFGDILEAIGHTPLPPLFQTAIAEYFFSF